VQSKLRRPKQAGYNVICATRPSGVEQLLQRGAHKTLSTSSDQLASALAAEGPYEAVIDCNAKPESVRTLTQALRSSGKPGQKQTIFTLQPVKMESDGDVAGKDASVPIVFDLLLCI
jgi:D-arabinose 1-dehydrogenase-like Zn-dependent alcohol dehydrogenase